MTIDEKFALQPDDVRQTYFAKALDWYYRNRKGQPSYIRCRALAASMWFADDFIQRGKKHERNNPYR